MPRIHEFFKKTLLERGLKRPRSDSLFPNLTKSGLKRFNFRKFLFLIHILNKKDKLRVAILILLIIISGIFIFTRIYLKLTIPVPSVGKMYREGVLKEPRTINPLYATNDTDRDLTKLIFSRLLNYDGKGKLILDLARSYEISEEGKTYKIELRKDVLWHDGKKLTADDVIFTTKTIQNPLYKSPSIANWQGVNVEKLDEYTIKFSLRSPYAPFIENLTIGILPKHIWEKINPEQAVLNEFNLKPIGSGPYKFDSIKQSKEGDILEYRLTRNKTYYREGPFIKDFIFTFYNSPDKIITAWRKGHIDGFSPTSKELIGEFNKTRYQLNTIATPRIFGIFLNQRKNDFLADGNIRKAIALSINKILITEKIAGELIPHGTPLPPSIKSNRRWIEKISLKTTETDGTGINQPQTTTYNPLAAKELLLKSGFKDENNDGILEKKITKKDGKKIKEVVTPLTFTLTTSDWPDLVRSAEIIKDGLKEIGINIVIDSRPLSELETSVIRTREFEMLLFGQVYGYEIDPFIFWHSSQIKDPGLNIALYSNKKIDKNLEEVRKISDETERGKRLKVFEKTFMEDLPAVFLFSQMYLYFLPSTVRGINIEWISLPSDRFNEVNRWYLDTKRVFRS